MQTISHMDSRVFGGMFPPLQEQVSSSWRTGLFLTGRDEAMFFTVYGPEMTELLNILRSVGIINVGGLFEFMNDGTPVPFEPTGQYTAKRTQDRFNVDNLHFCLEKLGLSSFDESFYLPPSNNKAVLFETTGRLPPISSYTLKEIRAKQKFGRQPPAAKW